MKSKCTALFFALLLMLLAVPLPAAAVTTMTVQHTGSGTNIFNTIQSAIDEVHRRKVSAPNSGETFEIKVLASDTAYLGPITLRDPISIFGERTGGTFISGGADTLVTISGISGSEIRNFTFRVAGTAISVSGNSAVDITNNVFQMGTANTAIKVADSPSTRIINNTFYKNKFAISTNSDLVITNNIFSANTTALSTSVTLSKLSYNDYFPRVNSGVSDLGNNSIPNVNQTESDPKFVDPDNSDFTKQDFHLQPGSPCIGSGNPQFANPGTSNSSDMGAYGGPKRDFTPATVTGVSTTLSSDGSASSLAVSWAASTTPGVTGYRVYYSSPDGATANEASPVLVLGATNTTLTGLPLAPTAPTGTPAVALTALSQALLVSWTQVSGATGYVVDYVSSDPPSSGTVTVSGGSTLSTTLAGLGNGVTYTVTVTPVAETRVAVFVTAVIDSTLPSAPGSSNESSPSTTVTTQIGVTITGTTSLPVSDFPEASTASPNLKGEGCFIATAAYGCYSAAQVQALRDFRDRYLMTNTPGRAFVAWYYHYGPKAAHFINMHPWLKAPVRVALLPLIILSLVLTGGSPLAKIGLLLLSGLLVSSLWRGRKRAILNRTALQRAVLLLLLVSLPTLAQAAEPRPDRPHWSLELKGGASFPSQSGFFGGANGEYGAALGYKVHRMVEVGVAASYLRGSGKGRQVAHNTESLDEVSYERVPVDAFVLGRLLFSEDQLLVPYLGAGYTRLFYRDKVSGGETTKVSVNGFHARAGMQVLLDRLEEDASRSLYHDFGIHHTYLFAEGKYLDARADRASGGSVNLGGTSVLGGFLFEF